MATPMPIYSMGGTSRRSIVLRQETGMPTMRPAPRSTRRPIRKMESTVSFRWKSACKAYLLKETVSACAYPVLSDD